MPLAQRPYVSDEKLLSVSLEWEVLKHSVPQLFSQFLLQGASLFLHISLWPARHSPWAEEES